MAVNDVYRASAIFTSPTADGEMVFTTHFRTVTVNTVISRQQEGQEIADECRDTIDSLYLQEIGADITFQQVNVIGITDSTVGAVATSQSPGTAVGDSMAMRNAPVVKLLTGLRGRSYNGRIYLMPPPESVNAGGVLLASYVTDLETFVTGYRRLSQQPSTNIYDMTIYSPTLSGPSGPIIDNLVETIICNPQLGSLRSRQKVTT